MTKVYYDSRELIIVEHLPPTIESGGVSLQDRIILSLGKGNNHGGRDRIYRADEIWFYSEPRELFISYKDRRITTSLLKEFLKSKGINIRCWAAEINTAAPTEYRFNEEKDHFLFKLKF